MVTIDPAKFINLSQTKFGPLKADVEPGLRSIIDGINKDEKLGNPRWVAYMLATIKHECADTWRPIEEYGKGHGRPYGKPESVTDQNGKVYENIYYGRGYVQLTWKANYEKMSGLLGLGDQLLCHPELALRADIAYQILSFGMRNGSFTGKRLEQFIHDAVCDYFNAREIINGHDQAAKIQGYAQGFEAMLKDCAVATQ
jgi:putative chitinase